MRLPPKHSQSAQRTLLQVHGRMQRSGFSALTRYVAAEKPATADVPVRNVPQSMSTIATEIGQSRSVAKFVKSSVA
jgi:hypothetical protein